tara:strand:- start:172 stop:354 length:183 start_codon:yes stop_codon:yes gene_type:complete
MNDFLEIEEKTKKVKSINLDSLSVEDLNKYVKELSEEIDKVKVEIKKKQKIKAEAEKMFK